MKSFIGRLFLSAALLLWQQDAVHAQEQCEPADGPIRNCASYVVTDLGDLVCQYCVSHYEINFQGRCTPCVVCEGIYGTMDFCPHQSRAWGGVIPHKPNGDLVRWPQVDQGICDQFVFWGADGYDRRNKDAYYCQNDDPVIWVYNISITQEDSDIIDGFKRPVIYGRGGGDPPDDYRIPIRGVYGCHQDSFYVNLANDMPDSVNGTAYPPDSGTNTMGVSIHWHGMLQENNQFMDGVAMLSTCPVGNSRDRPACASQFNDPGSPTFTYKFRANPAGTFWAHSHTGLEYGDGLVLPLMVYERTPGPYADDYNIDLDPLMMADWWHQLSQDLAVNLFYGALAGRRSPPGIPSAPNTRTVCELNGVRCTPIFEPDSASVFNCICAGGVSDYPFLSGYFNGKGQHPYIDSNTRRNTARNLNYHELQLRPNQRYRLRIINSGFNYAFRFSIDGHRFSVIAADGQYHKEVKQLTHFAAMPGERYDIIFKGKSRAMLESNGGAQYFMRATSYNSTYWFYNASFNDYEVGTENNFFTVYGVVNYDPATTQADWFRPGTPLARALRRPAPPVRKILDISLYWNAAEYATIGVPENRIVTKLFDYRFPGRVPGCTEPAINGKGPLGAPFGCTRAGRPLPVPTPDLLVHLWVNGIMYPAYSLFLAQSPVLDYAQFTANDAAFAEGINEIGPPNMFARASIPLTYTRGTYATRNLLSWGAGPDSPGYDPTRDPPPEDWGSETKHPYGSAGAIGVTNFTQMLYVPKNKWIMVLQHDGGPMTHPFHIHGYDVFTLGRLARLDQFRTADTPCTLNTTAFGAPDRKPLMLDRACARSAAPYMNGYGAALIPPTRGRHQPQYTLADIMNQSVTNMIDPPIRDMPLVSPHGTVAWMFYTDNPGAWFYHCHLEFHAGLGMGTVWMVGADGDDWLNGFLSQQQIGAFNEGNCADVEFEGPIQFY